MEDLQNLLEKINREGVEKAEAEAKRITDAAEAKAAEAIRRATDEAARLRVAAQKDAAAFAARAEETIRQSARDVVIGVKDSITTLLEDLLVRAVNKTLNDETAVSALVAEAVRELTGPGEITCGPQLATALASQLAAQGAFTLKADSATGPGFTVKLDGGRVEHAFTAEVIAAELAKHLRSDLAKLLK